MNIYIVFCHPSKESYSYKVLNSFIKGLEASNHTYEIGDLYEMKFKADMDSDQYIREIGLDPLAEVLEDVIKEQNKIDKSNALVFIYPLWWSDCPAKLKGWFDRVLTYGYAYSYDSNGNRGTKISIDKALVLCSAGHTYEHLDETKILESMKNIMINDRLLGVGVKNAQMEILDGIMPGDERFRESGLKKVYQLGKEF